MAVDTSCFQLKQYLDFMANSNFYSTHVQLCEWLRSVCYLYGVSIVQNCFNRLKTTVSQLEVYHVINQEDRHNPFGVAVDNAVEMVVCN